MELYQEIIDKFFSDIFVFYDHRARFYQKNQRSYRYDACM